MKSWLLSEMPGSRGKQYRSARQIIVGIVENLTGALIVNDAIRRRVCRRTNLELVGCKFAKLQRGEAAWLSWRR